MRIGGAWLTLTTANAVALDLAGVVLLGQVAARLSVFDLTRNRRDRRGRLRIARLGASLPELLRILSADCPRR
jgi:hypothetical protein